uniref:Small ribosomal subunit protein bS6m n=1 Tax=Alona affinis TaxID=381656 RepID=A0A9N6ZG84_9CRUS|nr:EOG090X0IQO [Alona affinis]
MPSYELSLLLRILSKPELVSSLKRTAETISDHGGVLRQFTSLGTSPLPFKMRAHNQIHREGTYFVMNFDIPSSSLDTLRDELHRDIDLVRFLVSKEEGLTSKPFECTLEEELQPPAYRKDVQKMIEEGQKQVRRQGGYNRNTPGFDYYPFQR